MLNLKEPIHVDDHLECQSLDQRLDASPLISMLVSQLAFIKDSHKQLKHSSDARVCLLHLTPSSKVNTSSSLLSRLPYMVRLHCSRLNWHEEILN